MRIRLRDGLAASALMMGVMAASNSALAQELVSLQGMAPQETVCGDVDGFPASALTDGDLTTLWRTDREIAPCHFVFRFENPVAVASVTLHNGQGQNQDQGTPSRRATVWASHQDFGRGYFRIAHQELNEEGATVLTLEEPILMRSLKIAVENPNPFSSNWLHASLAEIEIETVATDTAGRWPMPPLEPLANGDPITRTPATRCDELAAIPYNPDSYGFGREDDDIDVNEALTACRSVVAQTPQSMRLATQLARVEALAEQSVQSVARLGSELLRGYAPAQFLLAKALRDGDGIAENPDRSTELFTQAAEAEFLPARMQLARDADLAYREALVSGQSEPLGADEPVEPHLALLMEAGYVPAHLLYSSHILRTDTSALLGFMPRLEESAEYGQPGTFAQHLYNSQHGIPVAHRRSMRWIREIAAQLGSPSNMANLSVGLRYVTYQYQAATSWARRGAYSGRAWPVRVLAEERGGAGGQRLYAFSFQRGLERAEAGGRSDMFHVAEALISGNGVEQDRAEGARWMRLSAASGEARAIAYLQNNSWARAPEEQDQ